MGNFWQSYEDPSYDEDGVLVDEQSELQQELDEIYSPYHGA